MPVFVLFQFPLGFFSSFLLDATLYQTVLIRFLVPMPIEKGGHQCDKIENGLSLADSILHVSRRLVMDRRLCARSLRCCQSDIICMLSLTLGWTYGIGHLYNKEIIKNHLLACALESAIDGNDSWKRRESWHSQYVPSEPQNNERIAQVAVIFSLNIYSIRIFVDSMRRSRG